ncbi:hypothetical protein AK812_SmicGene38769, partial [Symbiodinium microadriaticum]
MAHGRGAGEAWLRPSTAGATDVITDHGGQGTVRDIQKVLKSDTRLRQLAEEEEFRKEQWKASEEYSRNSLNKQKRSYEADQARIAAERASAEEAWRVAAQSVAETKEPEMAATATSRMPSTRQGRRQLPLHRVTWGLGDLLPHGLYYRLRLPVRLASCLAFSSSASSKTKQAPLVYRHLFPGFLGSPPFLVRLPLRRPGHAGCLPRHLAVFLLPEPAVTVTAPGLQDKRATPRPVEELTSFTSEAGVRTTASSEDEDTVSWFRAFERAYEGSPSQALYGAAADDKWIGCIVYTPYVRPVPVSVRCKPHHELQHCLDGITDGAPGVDRYLYNCCIPTKPRGHTGYCIVLRFPSTSRGGTERPLAAVIIASSRDASQAGSFDEIFPASPQPARQLAVLVATGPLPAGRYNADSHARSKIDPEVLSEGLEEDMLQDPTEWEPDPDLHGSYRDTNTRAIVVATE